MLFLGHSSLQVSMRSGVSTCNPSLGSRSMWFGVINSMSFSWRMSGAVTVCSPSASAALIVKFALFVLLWSVLVTPCNTFRFDVSNCNPH